MAQFHPPKIYCVHLMAPSAGWHPPEPGCIGQTVNATISFRGSTAALLLPITRYEYQRLFAFYAFCREKRKPTSGLEPLTCSLRVCGRAFLGVAGVCKSRIENGFSVPCIAHHCRALRPG
jgi:hypothetical protein